MRPIPPNRTEISAQDFTVYLGTPRGTARAEVKNAVGKLVAFATGGTAILDMPKLPSTVRAPKQ
ncbi:MAG: hypothetical protein M3R30_04480 [Candidatus Eremiobacteraeota bacterium]|nr:hypothetical protein [Candidatus Eremiobacteraeota bacterium]